MVCWSLVIEPATEYKLFEPTGSSIVDCLRWPSPKLVNKPGPDLHISKATLDLSTTAGMQLDENISLLMDYEEQPIKGIILCNLNKKNKQESLIDLNFERKQIVTLYSDGQAVLHLTGHYFQPLQFEKFQFQCRCSC